jgi:hypothetical protein
MTTVLKSTMIQQERAMKSFKTTYNIIVTMATTTAMMISDLLPQEKVLFRLL